MGMDLLRLLCFPHSLLIVHQQAHGIMCMEDRGSPLPSSACLKRQYMMAHASILIPEGFNFQNLRVPHRAMINNKNIR